MYNISNDETPFFKSIKDRRIHIYKIIGEKEYPIIELVYKASGDLLLSQAIKLIDHEQDKHEAFYEFVEAGFSDKFLGIELAEKFLQGVEVSKDVNDGVENEEMIEVNGEQAKVVTRFTKSHCNMTITIYQPSFVNDAIYFPVTSETECKRLETNFFSTFPKIIINDTMIDFNKITENAIELTEETKNLKLNIITINQLIFSGINEETNNEETNNEETNNEETYTSLRKEYNA